MARWLFLASGLATVFMTCACEPKQQQASTAALAGQWVYDNNCAECHEVPQLELHKQPPSLHGLFLRKMLPSGALATDSQVRMTIVEGKGTMPAFDQRLRSQDVNNLIEYLHQLP